MDAPRALHPNPERLRQLRLERALSQRELAKVAGIRPGTVNRVEKGQPTRLSTIAAIAQALEVQPLELMRADG